ncbi:MAG: carbohydrate ABC transporter permease [Sphaerochaeta sp.]|jgi:multiple sugar transport system permease protein|uniref:carbohydrate ABC transporter permease n=1 Tax=Sphaerochaeta sp. TaxID=1972642 RepID=UPI003D122140
MIKKRTINNIIYYTVISLIGIVMIYPLLWMIFSSFKENAEIFKRAGSLFPDSLYFQNYANGWKGFGGISFSVFFKNSLILSIVGTIGSVISAAVVGYGFGRFSFPGKKVLFSCMMITMLLPQQVMMIPQFLFFKRLDWVGTYLPLTVPYFFGHGFFIFLAFQFVKGIPRELDESAKMDGCGAWSIFQHIILPLLQPAMVTITIFSFIWKWDDFMGALLYLNNPRQYPVTMALKMFSDPSSSSDWGAMFAMSSLSILPILIIFVCLQKYLMEGISTTGIKG